MPILNEAHTKPRPMRADQVREGDEIALAGFEVASPEWVAGGRHVDWHTVAGTGRISLTKIRIVTADGCEWNRLDEDEPVMVREMVALDSAEIEQRAALAERLRIVSYIRDYAHTFTSGDNPSLGVALAVDDHVPGRTRAEAKRLWNERLTSLVTEIIDELTPAPCWHCEGTGVVRKSSATSTK